MHLKINVCQGVSSLSSLFISLWQACKLHLSNYLCVMATRDINISGVLYEQLSQFQFVCRKSETEPVFHNKPEASDTSFKESCF